MPGENEPEFEERASTAFSFLLARGFRRDATPPPTVRFVNDSGVFVDVFHIPFERYIGFKVGLTSQPKDAINNEELRTVENVQRPRSHFGATEPSDPLEALAHLLEAHGERVLSGEQGVFDEARELRRRYTEQFTRRP